MPNEEVVSRIVVVIAVVVAVVRTTPPTAPIHLRAGRCCKAEHSRSDRNGSDFVPHRLLLFHSGPDPSATSVNACSSVIVAQGGILTFKTGIPSVSQSICITDTFS